MKLTIPVFLLVCLFSFPAAAQNSYSIKGAVADTALNARFFNATVSVLTAKDSMLVRFQRAVADGSFSINNLREGKFILLVTYPAYADYVELFSLDSSNRSHDFGKLNLRAKAKLLEEVVINGAAAITIKGDTTEFNARSFKIQPNSNVEDLLKQLPGIQVDKDGKITAQGQTVKKVLVDGEEFFGDDPTLVTKNIRGDMVDKVQVYDKKSDQAAFTGIDDGVKDKTINIKLKEGSKNGYFGKLDGGKSDNRYYQGQGMLNIFQGKKKYSAYGTVGNTGRTGLGWEDNGKYGSSNVGVSDEGYLYISGGGDDLESFDGRYNGEGLPLARTGGAHYDGKWNKDKESINLNYKLGSLSVESGRNTLTQNNLPGGIINNTSDQNSDNSIFRQKMDATYQVKLDSSSNLKISVDGTLKTSQTNTGYIATSLRGNNVLLNRQNRSLTNEGNQKAMNMSAFWTKKFKKTGRTTSLTISQSFNNNTTNGFLNSQNSFYNTAGILDSLRNIDQYKTNYTKVSAFNSNLTYSEPISKTFSVIFNYGAGLNTSSADRKSFNKAASGGYDVFDPLFSNNFELAQFSNQGGAVFNYVKKKTTLNFGTKATAVRFRQTDLYSEKKYDRNFLNWLPQASYLYKFSQQKSFSMRYSGSTTQPNIDQIQPVRVNTDPLNITLGNPDLKPSFRSNFNTNYNSYKVLSDQSVYISASYSFVNNPIVNNTITDAAGKSTFQSFNLKDKKSSNFSIYADMSRKIKINDFDFNLGFNLYPNGSTFYNFVNGVMNKTQTRSYSGGISLSKYAVKKYDFYLNFNPNYSTSESSLQKQVNNNGWGFNSSAYINLYLPGKVQITSEASYQFKEKTQSFNQDFSKMILNTTLSKKFMKKENLKLSVSGNDLLNQNTGFNRSATSNMITQNSYNTIKRYLMFSIVWDFTKMGGAPPQK